MKNPTPPRRNAFERLHPPPLLLPRNKTGKPLGKKCPQLSSRKHGAYSVRPEIPPHEDGTRRSFSRAGYDPLKDAQADLDHVRSLLALADRDDSDSLQRLVAMVEEVSVEKAPLPAIKETRRRLRAGLALRGSLTVGEWLDQWFAAKKRRKTTLNGYASHIRVHLKPRIGHLRLDRLNVGHLVGMFDAIADENEVISAENEARREQITRCKPSKPGRPVGAERQLLAAERAKPGKMKPFRKTTGPASRQAIRRTLRTALNSAIAQQLITFNPASHVELESGRRPKPLLWAEERVRRWHKTKMPGPVMVWTPQQFGAFLDAAEGDRLYAIFHARQGDRGGRLGHLRVRTEAKEDGSWLHPETVSETLRYSTITLTSDTCTSLLPELDRDIAEKAAKLIPRSRPAAADSSAQAAPDPQATSTSAHASLTQWLENEAAPDPTEADSGAA